MGIYPGEAPMFSFVPGVCSDAVNPREI